MFIQAYRGPGAGAPGGCVCQACPTLLDPMDCSLPGSSVHGILRARIVEWAAMPSSRDLPSPGIEPMSPGSPALQADSLASKPPGKPYLQEFPVL